MYSYENQGRYPDQIEDLIFQDLVTDNFICPASADSAAATGATTQQTAANIAAGGHLSYVYVARGMTTTAPANAVLAYEALSHHGDGSNVLFADYHVKLVPASIFRRMISELNTGQNPPPATKGQ